MSKNIKRLTKQKLGEYKLEKEYVEDGINYVDEGNVIDVNIVQDGYFENKICNKASFKTKKNETLYLKSKFYLYTNNKVIERLSKKDDKIKNKKYGLEDNFIKLKNVTQYNKNEKKKLFEKFSDEYTDSHVRYEKKNKENYIVRDYFVNEKELIKTRIEFLQVFEELLENVFSNENINYENVTLEYVSVYKSLLKKINIKEEIMESLKKYKSENLFTEYVDNKGDVQNVTSSNIYRVLLKNTKRSKMLFNYILEEILEKLDDITEESIVEILNRKETNDLIFEYITTYKVKDISRFLNATVERNQKFDNSTRREKIEEQIKAKKILIELGKGEITEKIKKILIEDYDIDKLLEKIEDRKPNDFIGVKKILNQHFVSQFLEGETLKYKKDYTPEEQLLIKEINEFLKGRYRKIKKEQKERYQNIKPIFKNEKSQLTNKIIERVGSRIYTSYINYNKYEVFLHEDIQDKYKDSSVFKETIKCEDTFRKKLSTYISELNFMYFAKLKDSNDILGTKDYSKMKERFSEVDKTFSTISQISNKEVEKEEFLNKMYSAFELRNHVYHYQKLLKFEMEGNEEGYKNFKQEYDKECVSSYVEIFNRSLSEDFSHILISNNIWILEEEYQENILEIIGSNFEDKPTYLVRFDKLFSKRIKYTSEVLDTQTNLKETLYTKLELDSSVEIKDKFKAMINGSLRYYYQTYYDYSFFEYLNDYGKISTKMNSLLNTNKFEGGEEHPLLLSVNKIVRKSSSLEELVYNLQSDAGGSQKQIKNYNDVYIQLLIHLFYDFVSENLILSVDKINKYIEVEENREKDKKNLICELTGKIKKIDFNLVTEEKIESIFNNELTLRLFSISEFLKKRSISSMGNDLKKYSQFLIKLKEKYEESFKEVWVSVYSKIIGTDEVDFDTYIISIKDLIDVLELIILSIDKNKALRFKKNFLKNNQQILKFYGVDNKKLKNDDLIYKVFDTNQKKEIKQSIIESEKKYDDGTFEIRTIPHDFFIEEENQGKLNFLMKKHIEYVETVFNDGYKDILNIYSDLRKQVSNIESMKILSRVYSDDYNDDLEELVSLKNFVKELLQSKKVEDNKDKEFIVYVQETYKKKYKEFIKGKRKGKKLSEEKENLFKELRNLKNIINFFDFISNLINLKSVNKAEQLVHDIHSRYVSGYRDIERNYVYLNNLGDGVESIFQKNKVGEMLNKIMNVDDTFIFNKKNLKSKKSIIVSRNFTAHKKGFQEEQQEDRKLNGTVNNEGYRLRQIYKYDTKSLKALTDIYVSTLEKKNIEAKSKEYEKYDFTYGIKYFMEDLEFCSGKTYAGIPLISELEVQYLMNFIDEVEKTKVLNPYDNGLFKDK